MLYQKMKENYFINLNSQVFFSKTELSHILNESGGREQRRLVRNHGGIEIEIDKSELMLFLIRLKYFSMS